MEKEKVYVLHRRIHLLNGSIVSIQVGAFANQELAKKAISEANQNLAGVIQQARCTKVYQRPDGQLISEDMGASVQELLQALGISGYDHQTSPIEVTTSSLLVPEKGKIILPH